MCIDEFGLSFEAGERFLMRKGDLCKKALVINRGLICGALVVLSSKSSEALNCLDGNSPCGLMGMLWKKFIHQNLRVEINGLFPHSMNVINANLAHNKIRADVVYEDLCTLLRKNTYNFIYINCKNSTPQYLDSLFSNAADNTVIVITTSEDSSLCWQSPKVALRNYSGVIVKTSYIRELGIRLVLAEMARAAARYNKGISVLCAASFKVQQSFTIIVRVEASTYAADNAMEKIQKLLHCNVCEDRAYLPNSKFPVESAMSLLTCDCSKNVEMKAVVEVGPIWSGDLYSSEFVESILNHTKGYPWESKILLLLMQLLEEARCYSGKTAAVEPIPKSPRLADEKDGTSEKEEEPEPYPSFYFNTHKHRPSNNRLQKVTNIVRTLRQCGFRASRTHFDPNAVRTNATLRDYMRLLEQDRPEF